MRYHQVEVDNDVFQYVKEHAEPLVDNFNSVIKRLIGLANKHPSVTAKSIARKNGELTGLSIPRGIPRALRQILEVAYLVSKHGLSRTDATRDVAKINRVTPQTVLDKYCRQLGLSASGFEQLLYEPGQNKLRSLLNNKFHGHGDLIEKVLSDGYQDVEQ